jgi:hypothetical protein
MQIQDLLGIGVVGAIMTGLIQLIKSKFGTEGLTTKFITIGLALVIGGLYVWLRSTSYFETAILILATSSTVYALFVK